MGWIRPLCAAGLLLAASACDSTTPEVPNRLSVEGMVAVAGTVPVPVLPVRIRVWPAPEPGGVDSVATNTDQTGSFTAEFGPFAGSVVDSLEVRVVQYDCVQPTETTQLTRQLATDSAVVRLPTLTLSAPLGPAQLGSGATMCASSVTATQPGLIGDYARLALWVDDVSDSVRGRWRLNHSASIGDDYGYFSGAADAAGLELELRPTGSTPCGGIHLVAPLDGATIGPATLASGGGCSVADGTVRFYDGAVLQSLQPPL